jgi:hypothetical protein
MTTEPSTKVAPIWRDVFRGEASSCGRVVVSWTTAGGVAAGGLLLGLTALGSPEEAQELLPLAPVLFLLGAAAGLVHGGVLAYVGRPAAVPGRAALARIGISVPVAIIALLVAWVAAAWISLTSAVLTLHAWRTAVVTGLGWIAGTAVCCWAAVEGWHALERAFARWPESRPGTLLLSGALAILALALVVYRPPLGSSQLHLTGFGALLLAFVATLWIATPVVVVLLHFVHKWFAPVWDPPAQS